MFAPREKTESAKPSKESRLVDIFSILRHCKGQKHDDRKLVKTIKAAQMTFILKSESTMT